VTPQTGKAAAAWRAVLRTPEGCDVLRVILFKICEMEKGTHEPGADVLTVLKLEGLREAGRKIRAQIEAADPTGYVMLLQQDIADAQARRGGASA